MTTTESALSLQLVIEDVSASPNGVAAGREDSILCRPLHNRDGREIGFSRRDQRDCLIQLHGVGRFFLSGDSPYVRGLPDPGVGAERVTTAFWRRIAPRLLYGLGREVLHASGLEIGGVRVALCGDTRAGKSTLAYAWQRLGGEVYTDDAIPYHIEGDRAVVDPISFRIKLRHLSREHFGLPTLDRSGLGGEEAFRVARGAERLSSIYRLNRRDSGEGSIEIERVTPSVALTAMLRSSLCFGERGSDRLLQTAQACVDLIRLVPVFRVSYPSDLDRIDEVLACLSDHVAQLSGETRNAGRERDADRS